MDHDNGLIGRLLAGAGGVLLVVSVFLTWYSLNLGDLLRGAASQLPAQASGLASSAIAQAGTLTLTASGWHAIHTIRFVVLLVGIAVVISSIAPSATADNGGAALLIPGGLLVALLVAYRIESPPDLLEISVGPFQLSSATGAGAALSGFLHVHAGAWAALIGAVLVVLGGWLQLRRGRSSIAVPTPTSTLPASRLPMPTLPLAPTSKPPPGS